MKENENEEQLKENKEQEPKIQIIEDNNIQSGDNNHLESLDTLINPDSGPYLKTVRTLLTEEPKYKEGYADKIILQVEEKESSTPRIIFNIKNNVLVFCLLYSSFMNYNFLYFPYIILGFALSACLYKNKNPKIYHFKQISELIILIYSFLLLAFKAVFIVLTKNDNELAVNNKKLLINLGVKLLRDKESVAYLVSSLLTECIIIVTSLVSYIISKTFTDYKLEDDTKIKGISKREMFNLLIKHLIINYFILLFNAILNTSIFTLLYLGLALVLFFFTASYSNNLFPDPLTDEEEEKYLKLMKEGDKEARNKLIEHNLRLVAHIVKKFDQDDLISIGTIGLIKGIDTYSLDKSVKLTTYCARCIQNEILMFYRSNNKNNKNISINESIGFDKEGNEITILDILKSEKPDFAMDLHTKENIKLLNKYIEVLNNREKDIITRRYGLFNKKEQTQKTIAKNLGISRSYVSRIEKRALIKMLREFIKNKNITEE